MIFLHGSASLRGFVDTVYVAIALIDMHAKCGNLDGAPCAFHGMRESERNVFT